MIHAQRLHEESLPLRVVRLRFVNLDQAGEVIRVAVRHEDAVDRLGLVGARFTIVPAGEIARKELIVAAVDQH